MAENDVRDQAAENTAETAPPPEAATTQDVEGQDVRATTAAANPAAAPRKKSRLGPWLFLLLIFIGLPAAWLFSPTDTRQQMLGLLQNFTPQIQPPVAPAHVPDPVAEIPQTAPSTETAAIVPLPEPAPKPAPGATEGSPAASVEDTASDISSAISSETNSMQAVTVAVPPASLDAEQAASLLAAMQQLQGALAAMRTEVAGLQQQFQTRNRQELRSRLRWLARADTRLQQRAVLWSDIASLPNLSAAQLAMTEEMVKLARDDLQHLGAWRKTLTHLAESLTGVPQADILPKSENRYLAWLIDAFHLRPAPAERDIKRADLQRQILAMEHALSTGNWPQASAWRHLLGALRDRFGEDAVLDLPESVQDVQQHIAIMRDHAADWLENL